MADSPHPPPTLGRPTPVMVELLFERTPDLDHGAIARRAAERAGSPTEIAGADDVGTRGIAFPEITVPFVEGALPLTVWLMPVGERTIDEETSMAQTLRQTWAWDDAEATVRQAREAILVVDIAAGPLDRSVRLPAYHSVLGASVEVLHPAALRFAVGERYVDPAAYLRDLAADSNAFESTVNVRFVTMSDRPGEQLMDTVGMASFALPDIQLHFTTLDPSWVAGKLLGIARYLFERGDIIEDGNTVPGLNGERWPCVHELALMGPEREVLDIDPSPHGPRRG